MKCKIFKIHPKNEPDEAAFNQFLANANVKQVFASVVNDIENFWSVLVLYEEQGVISEAGGNAPSLSSPVSAGKSYSIKASAAIPAKPTIPEPAPLTPEQETSFNALKSWRDARARAEGLPAYVIAHDELLMQIAAAPVKTPEDLLKIKDFGHKRTQIYGDEIVRILSAHA